MSDPNQLRTVGSLPVGSTFRIPQGVPVVYRVTPVTGIFDGPRTSSVDDYVVCITEAGSHRIASDMRVEVVGYPLDKKSETPTPESICERAAGLGWQVPWAMDRSYSSPRNQLDAERFLTAGYLPHPGLVARRMAGEKGWKLVDFAYATGTSAGLAKQFLDGEIHPEEFDEAWATRLELAFGISALHWSIYAKARRALLGIDPKQDSHRPTATPLVEEMPAAAVKEEREACAMLCRVDPYTLDERTAEAIEERIRAREAT